MTEPDPGIIAAVATPPGRGGVGIVRVSGPSLGHFIERLSPRPLSPRTANLVTLRDSDGEVIDQVVALYFPAPHSFTGEDVLELQGHGGPVVMDSLLARALALGARLARPGEFSERAFINDKIDLAQAEAIADLIDASSRQAARSAMRSLEGEFSRRIQYLVEELIRLRIYVEAAIDFPDEEIDFLSDGVVAGDIDRLLASLDAVVAEARQGALLREGMTVVIAGKPNAGKSSLLNALSGRDSAIVTEVAGTTRDVLRESIHIDGMPLHIVDTAGLRDSVDRVEQEGIRRAWDEIERADRILFVVDAGVDPDPDPVRVWPEFFRRFPDKGEVTVVHNKVDLAGIPAGFDDGAFPLIGLSAKTGEGLDLLRSHLKTCMGFQSAEGGFIARRRHLDALARARTGVVSARTQLTAAAAGELVAEDLRYSQRALGEITGEFSADDLLGRIFSSFCIGK